ncbi:MAG: helix-hairpin-helix domain-containing protein, partial [Ginsengibacter sp.]
MKRIKEIRSLPLFPLFIFILGISNPVKAQEISNEPDPVIQQQLEDLTATNEDEATENDSYLQEIQHFLKEPINLNYADAGLLEELKLLNPVQINNLLSYRKLLGNFLSIYELQAIPAWSLELIRRIRPFITI